MAGVAGPQCGTGENSGSVWEVTPKKVKVLYAKFSSDLEVSQVQRSTGNSAGIQPDHGLSLNTRI